MLGDSETSGLGFQLAMYRWMDNMKEARHVREDRIAAFNLDLMITEYNDLVERFNRLWNGCMEAGKEFDRSMGRGERSDRAARRAHCRSRAPAGGREDCRAAATH